MTATSQHAPEGTPRRLTDRSGAFLTHASLLGLTAFYFVLLVRLPFWAAFIPCVVLVHRIGIMIHEYFHGITLKTYRDNLAVVTLWDGIMMTYGMLEVVRGAHLAHHKWTNQAQPGEDHHHDSAHEPGGFRLSMALDSLRHLNWLADGLRGKRPYVRPGRIVAGFLLSLFVIAGWILVGHGEIVWQSLVTVAFTVTGPMSLRGAIEHSSQPGNPDFANEYTTFLPIFNINRHIHHHEDTTVPWYALEWRTQRPLPASSYFTRWIRLYITKELVPMQPPPKRRARARRGDGGPGGA
ncbi:MAG: fatty acid desaturase [Gemmatimonadetes bacterium]|nr:fatty acid desaturase [Gemmatimonadota bacterium]